jgi:hypothetical protein
VRRGINGSSQPKIETAPYAYVQALKGNQGKLVEAVEDAFRAVAR